jgi:hypothetical protein
MINTMTKNAATRSKIPTPISSAFLKQYLETALWSSTDSENDDEPFDRNHDINDFSNEALAKATADCNSFIAKNEKDLARAGDDEQNGHDFWLTRNGHGAGFWDRGYDKGVSDRLTKASKTYGDESIYRGDDGKLYFE